MRKQTPLIAVNAVRERERLFGERLQHWLPQPWPFLAALVLAAAAARPRMGPRGVKVGKRWINWRFLAWLARCANIVVNSDAQEGFYFCCTVSQVT